MMETSRREPERHAGFESLERDVGARMRAKRAGRGALAFGLLLVGTLSACQPVDEVFGDYPALNTVPEAARPSTPTKERRQIVRDLIEDRDESRIRTAVIRDRSGVAASAFPDVADENFQAEDVILEPPAERNEPFRLTPGSEKIPADSVYRSESQVEDGGLDDFIRQLKRDTTPPATRDELDSDEFEGGETSFWSPSERDPADFATNEGSSIWLAAFAPAVRGSPPGERDLMVRLAAAEDEPGFFCRWAGWVVAWSNMCVEDVSASSAEEGEQGVVADVEPETEGTAGEAGADERRSARSQPQSSDEARQERTERRLSEEDAAEALEEAGRSVLGPVAGSLDKLRDFIRERRSAGTTSSSPQPESVDSLRPASPSSSSQLSSRPVEVVDPPLIPKSRPERRENVTIVDEGETFDFHRTPKPAFKPLYDDQALVILPPETPSPQAGSTTDRLEPPPRPSIRPSDLLPPDRERVTSVRDRGPDPVALGDALDDETVAFAMPADANLLRAPDALSEDQPASTVPDVSNVQSQTLARLPTPEVEALDAAVVATSESLPDALSSESEPVFIRFERDAQTLPEGATSRLASLLDQAKSEHRKIHIIGEAATNHLAKRRAKDVGAALVKLGATVELLEYDHDVKNGADQVRLELRSGGQGAASVSTGRTTLER